MQKQALSKSWHSQNWHKIPIYQPDLYTSISLFQNDQIFFSVISSTTGTGSSYGLRWFATTRNLCFRHFLIFLFYLIFAIGSIDSTDYFFIIKIIFIIAPALEATQMPRRAQSALYALESPLQPGLFNLTFFGLLFASSHGDTDCQTWFVSAPHLQQRLPTEITSRLLTCRCWIGWWALEWISSSWPFGHWKDLFVPNGPKVAV